MGILSDNTVDVKEIESRGDKGTVGIRISRYTAFLADSQCPYSAYTSGTYVRSLRSDSSDETGPFEKSGKFSTPQKSPLTPNQACYTEITENHKMVFGRLKNPEFRINLIPATVEEYGHNNTGQKHLVPTRICTGWPRSPPNQTQSASWSIIGGRIGETAGV